jgi:predicted MFS family arabinose efflux permease
MAHSFSRYEKFVIGLLAFLQFTIVLDFMIMGPLGALLLPALHISPRQFGLVVSAYAFSAACSGVLAAGFADRFDRKRLLLFFYTGFLVGTLLCGIANSYTFLLGARIVTGLFGGVIGSISMAIVADLFPLEVRGRVMGTVQTAFAASQVMGVPLGVLLSNHWGWHAPFLLIVLVSTAVGVVIASKLRPIDAHLKLQRAGSSFAHLRATVGKPRYLRTFAATMLLATGGFMLMPFGSAFSVHNLGISLDVLPAVYAATGVTTFIAGPVLGRWSDALGKYRMFCLGTALACLVVPVYCNLGRSALYVVILLNMLLFVAITARIISASALISGVPDPADRGAFMSVNASLQQLSGGVSASLAGSIVQEGADGRLLHYDTLGYVVVAAMLIVVGLMYPIHRAVAARAAAQLAGASTGAAAVPERSQA